MRISDLTNIMSKSEIREYLLAIYIPNSDNSFIVTAGNMGFDILIPA
jgi:hypothetical protein